MIFGVTYAQKLSCKKCAIWHHIHGRIHPSVCLMHPCKLHGNCIVACIAGCTMEPYSAGTTTFWCKYPNHTSSDKIPCTCALWESCAKKSRYDTKRYPGESSGLSNNQKSWCNYGNHLIEVPTPHHGSHTIKAYLRPNLPLFLYTYIL